MNNANAATQKLDEQFAEISAYLQRTGQEMIVRRNGQIVFRPTRRLWLLRNRQTFALRAAINPSNRL